MPSDPAALLLLALELAPLVRDLKGWEPVEILSEQVRAAAADADSLSEREVKWARSWVRRWMALPPGLRAFYQQAAPAHTIVSHGLWLILAGQAHRATPGVCSAVHQAYRTQHGHSPPWSLLPRVP